MPLTLHRIRTRWRHLVKTLDNFPWRNTLSTLQQRFHEDHLGVTASSLTFTTLLALVPFFTVLLSVFTAFPSFSRLQEMLQRWLVDNLIPGEIAAQVMDYLFQFASKASQLGFVGLAFLALAVVSLILTMDRTLNGIWRVQRLRPLGQRLLVYWAVLTLGPILMGLSIATTSYVLSASKGLVQALPEALELVFNAVEFLLLCTAMAALYHFVPNTPVKWRHAWTGGFFVAAGMAVAKKVLGMYLATVPTYSAIYGTFATLPILLIWIYMCWAIFLLGAVIAAYLPSLLTGMGRKPSSQGWDFELALEIIAVLEPLRAQPQRGMLSRALAKRLRVDRLHLEPALAALTSIRWVGAMPDTDTSYLEETDPRFVLLADPDYTPLKPLLEALLLTHSESTEVLWERAGWDETLLRDVLPAVRTNLPGDEVGQTAEANAAQASASA